MLVLSRDKFEKVIITLPDDPGELAALAGATIEVQVVSAERGKARLGLTAPKCVRLDREEIHARRLAG